MTHAVSLVRKTAVVSAMCVACVAITPSDARAQAFVDDARLHVVATTSISAVAYGGARSLNLSLDRRFPFAWTVSFGAGAAKELLDVATHGDASWRDLGWDAFGALVGATVGLLVDLLVGQ